MANCAHCGSDITDTSISGRCPACLLALALGDFVQRENDGLGRRTIPHTFDSFPRTFGNYVLLGELGQGGMGTVYRAYQEELDRDVALKIMSAGAYAGKRDRERFMEESRVAASLQHPNIVRLFEAGEVDGCLFYSMELIEGNELGTLTESQSVSTEDIVGIVCKVAETVHHAHSHKVIHRDLKPSNILVDQDGLPHITDFGLAKRLDQQATLSEAGRLLGTPGFWPPEQLEDDSTSGPAGDIYGLGAILYASLVGRPPFQADSVEALLVQIVSNEPIPLRRLKPDIPVELETITAKCLEKDPLRRYQSAGDLADDLRRFLRNEPIAARPTGPFTRLRKWARRKPALAFMATLLLITFVAGFTVSVAQWQRAEEHAQELTDTVVRLKYDRADIRLNESRTAEGLALLSALLREHPDHHVAKHRLVDTLLRRRFIVPEPWVATNDSFRFVSAFAMQDNLVVTASDEARRLTVWDFSEDVRHFGDISVGRPVRATAMDERRQSLLAATADGFLYEYDIQSLSRKSGPHPFPGIPEQVLFVPGERQAVVLSVPDLKSDNYRRRQGTVIQLDTGEHLYPDVRFHDVAFGSNSRRLVTMDQDDVRVRDGRDWSSLTPEVDEPSFLNDVVFTPDSSRFVTGSGANNATIWDTGTGKIIRRLRHPVNVQEVLVSPLGRIAFTLDVGSQGRFWDLDRFEQIGDVFPALKGFDAKAFAPDGRLFLARADSGLQVYDPASGRPVSEVINPGSITTRASFLPDGRRLVTTSFNGIARLWSLMDTQLEPVVMRDSLEVEYVSISPDGGRIATGVKGSWSRIWDLRSGKRVGEWLRHGRSVRRVHWSSDGERLVTASRDRTAQVWDAGTQERIGAAMEHDAPVWDAMFSPDGLWVATASEDGTARIWRADDGEPRSNALSHDGPVQGVAFRPAHPQLATYSRDRTVRLWSVPDGTPVGTPFDYDAEVNGVVFHPSGRMMAVYGTSDHVDVWKVDEREPAFPPIRHSGMIQSVDFSPDGSRIVTSSVDDTARIWSADSGLPLTRPLRHQADVLWVRFSPDGTKVLTASDDGTAQIWDAVTGLRICSPFRHENRVVVGQWLPDGSGVVTASYDRTTRFWPLPDVPLEKAPPWLIDLAESRGGIREVEDGVMAPINPDEVVQLLRSIRGTGDDGPWERIRNSFLSE